MGWIRRILGLDSGDGRVPGAVRARYDASRTTDENRRHWANADNLSALAWSSPEDRRKLRARSRYEAFNNSYARGIVETIANDTIGTGPRLQVRLADSKLNHQIEVLFNLWADRVSLANKLRQMRRARAIDGESFAVFFQNPAVVGRDDFDRPTNDTIPLDIRIYEADQCATPNLMFERSSTAVDGITFDKWGNPAEYHILTDHPGDPSMASVNSFQRVKARDVIHYFIEERPGQRRGVPEFVPSLNLFAQLRRYTLAVLAAAETAADFAAVAESISPADDDTDDAEPFDTLELERRMMTVLPRGYKLGQIKAEQPTTTYKEFKAELINEMARSWSMPFNIAAANSAGYNYSSGRLDHQLYFKCIRVEQKNIERTILARVFRKWLSIASTKTGFLPNAARILSDIPIEWFWDGFEHVDPVKEETADQIALDNNTTTLAEICARRGQDWETVLDQRSKEMARMSQLGLPTGEPRPAPVMEDEDDDETDEE